MAAGAPPSQRADAGLVLLLPLVVLLLGAAPLPGSADTMIEPPLPHELAIPRQRRFDLTAYGGKPGGVALNTAAFEAAVAAIKQAGGGELYVPPGVWLTTGFALTNHMSVFIEAGATVLGAPPNNTHWRPRNESCSSYACKVECRGPHGTEGANAHTCDERSTGYEPIIGGWNLTDVLITGNNGTLAGQADVWWAARPSLEHGRPHALLFSRCQRVVVSNLTIKDSPFWTLRFWASQEVRATNLTITATRHVFNNDGVDIDSTQHAVVEDVYYDGGDDAVALKSGLCKAGVEFATPTANVRIENFIARTRDACFCTGSEDEGGTHNVTVRGLNCRDSPKGILLKDASTFGGLHPPKSNMSFEDVVLHNISLWCHDGAPCVGPVPATPEVPGDGLTVQGVDGITIKNVVGTLVPHAGKLQLVRGATFVNISIGPGGAKHGFSCGSNVSGVTAKTVSPPMCGTAATPL